MGLFPELVNSYLMLSLSEVRLSVLVTLVVVSVLVVVVAYRRMVF